MSDRTLADAAIEERAAVLLAAHGIGPDDIERLIRLGVSDTSKIEVLLPSEFNPTIAATLLSLMARSILDTAHAAREAAREAERITERVGGKRLTFKALDPDRPH